VVLCLERGADCLHMVQLMSLHPKTRHRMPHLNPDWFSRSVASLPRLSWKKGCETGVVAVTMLCSCTTVD